MRGWWYHIECFYCGATFPSTSPVAGEPCRDCGPWLAFMNQVAKDSDWGDGLLPLLSGGLKPDSPEFPYYRGGGIAGVFKEPEEEEDEPKQKQTVSKFLAEPVCRLADPNWGILKGSFVSERGS